MKQENIMKGKWKMNVWDNDEKIEKIVCIPLEEYKELLVTKGKYIELKEKNKMRNWINMNRNFNE